MSELIELRSASGELRVRLERESGSLVGLSSAALSWEALGAGRGARPFELLLPRPDNRANRTRAARQPRPELTEGGDGTAVELRWPQVVSEGGGAHEIALTAGYALDGDALVCRLEVENRSALVVENVTFPCLTDVQALPSGDQLDLFTYAYASAQRGHLRPSFTNVPGYFGVDRPTLLPSPYASTVPGAPFVLLEGAGGGLYVGIDAPQPELLTWVAELEPGYSGSMGAWVPPGATIGPKDVRVEVSTVHLPFVMPGEHLALPPVRVQFYAGDWQAGAAIYRARRRTWMGPSAPPGWAAGPHSWQQVQMNSPEGERRYRFAELPEIARECAERGVKAIQVVGWNDGGQDQNNPSHDPDPLLGGAEELRQAIAECQRSGVKIVLFAKFVWSDRATERFRSRLSPLAVRDPYGDYYMNPGARYQTFTQLLDINTKRLVPMCFATEGWTEVCRQEFQKVLASGADGMLNDECFHHVPALACFDTAHGHRYGQPVYAHDVDFVRGLKELSGPVRDDFLYAGEACTDWQLSEYHLSYHRSESAEHVPLMRFLRPDALLMTAVTGFDDRNMVNQCLLYRYIISYEPYNFKGRLTDMPLTVAYGQRMDAMRAELRHWLWDGEFQGTIGARVADRSSGQAHGPFSVFKSATDGSLAAVVANYSADERAVDVVIDGRPGARYRLVDHDDWLDATEGVRLPARSAAVVV